MGRDVHILYVAGITGVFFRIHPVVIEEKTSCLGYSHDLPPLLWVNKDKYKLSKPANIIISQQIQIVQVNKEGLF